MKRREFIAKTLITTGSLAAFNVGLTKSAHASRKEKAYAAENSTDAINALFNKGTSTNKALKVKMKAPGIAENGLVVPITIDARKRDDIQSIAIVIDENPRPLASFVKFEAGSEAYFSTRVKMAKTSNVRAILNTNSGLEEINKEVKVTIGGCGG